MTRRKCSSKVHLELCSALCRLTACIKDSYEQWLQAVEELPRHMQPPDSEAATNLVQAALQEVPQIGYSEPIMKAVTSNTGQSRPDHLAWLFKHLPGISAAMEQAVSSQLGAFTTRISILRSLVTSKQGVVDDQLSARLEAERDKCLLLMDLVGLVSLVLPAAALVDVLLHAQDAMMQYEHLQHSHDRRQQLSASKDLDKVVTDEVRIHLDHAYSKAIRSQHAIVQAGQHLEELGMKITRIDREAYRAFCVRRCIATALGWLLSLADQLLPGSSGVTTVRHITGNVLFAFECDAASNFTRRVLAWTLAQPKFYAGLSQVLEPEEIAGLVQGCHITADLLHAAGMSAEQQQQLCSALGTNEGILQQCSVLDSQTGCAAVSSDCNLVGNHSAAAAADGSSGKTDATAFLSLGTDDGGLDDMQALLRLMYG